MEINMKKSKSDTEKFSPLLWNGATQTTERWASRTEISELWNDYGNCLIYLHAKSSRISSPSFKIFFADLLAAQCQPLMNNYIHFDSHSPNTVLTVNTSDEKATVQLYIPPEVDASAATRRHHHVAMRNLFAWVVGEPVVGEHLGPTLEDLLRYMQRYRSTGTDSVTDLVKYLESQGYLCYAGQPSFALGVLHFAEQTQLRDLYINAFCHCVGMTDKISSNSEYMRISLQSRSLLRKAREAMNTRLKRATKMVRNFLQNELSEEFLGLQPGTRAQLNLFRSFLLAHYNDGLATTEGTVLRADVLETMCQDFQALYKLLVDDECEFRGTVSKSTGGICVLQAIQSFESRHKLEPLPHALPLLPAIEGSASSFLGQWISRMDRGKPRPDVVAHAALTNATNQTKGIDQNKLVQAYKRFEEERASKISRLDKADRMSLVDGRKVRWILIYATYQVIRNATMRPEQVQTDKSPYLMAVSTDNLPPWDRPATAGASRPSTTTTEGTIGRTATNLGAEKNKPRPPTSLLNIQPDVDYYALTHNDQQAAIKRRSSIASAASRTTQALSRSASVTRALTRSYTFRRSRRHLKDAGRPEETAGVTPQATQSQAFHEIVVHGYGNGMNDVNVGMAPRTEEEEEEEEEEERQSRGNAMRNNSTMSQSASSMSVRNSVASSAEYVWASSKGTTPSSPMTEASDEDCATPPCWNKPVEDASSDVAAIDRNSSRRSLTRLHSLKSAFNHASQARRNSTFERRNSIKESFSSFSFTNSNSGGVGNLARSHSLRLPDMRRRSYKRDTNISPIEIDEHDEQPWGKRQEEDDEWDAMETFLEADTAPKKAPAWEQYSNLGGLIEV